MSPRCLAIQVVASASTAEALREYRAADPRADLVEIRLDSVRDLDLDRLLSARGKPRLIAARSRQQGGGLLPAERAPLLKRALAAGVEYLDIELGDEDLPFVRKKSPTRLILSFHGLDATPNDLPALYATMRKACPRGLVKIVTFAEVGGDILRVRDLLRSAAPGTLIAFCSGAKGVPSRILAPLWGSAAMYAPRRGGTVTAPGQVAFEDLFDRYRFDTIDAHTRLLGIVGNPLDHSLSPHVHNAALQALALNYRYLPFEAATLAEFLPLMSELRVHGLSVTLPHKEKILPYLDTLDDAARVAGAVNTVVKPWNRLEGHNTDVAAALAPLAERMSLTGARVAVMGAGGAARALLAGLSERGAKVTVFSRNPRRDDDLARRFGARILPWPRLRGFRCDLLINATPVGMAPDFEATPVPSSWVSAPRVYDLVYNPPETRFLREARGRGVEGIGGLEMFLAQAMTQFRLFTGAEPPAEVMRHAAESTLATPPSATRVRGRRGRGTRS
jgi:3-dehydroquinate dehydratase/shikimate dehydrogenase